MSTYHIIAFVGDKTCTTHLPRETGDYYIPSLAYVWDGNEITECGADNCLTCAFDLSIGTIGQLSLYNDRTFGYVTLYDFDGDKDSYYDTDPTSIKNIGEGSQLYIAIEQTVSRIFEWAERQQEAGVNDSVVFDAVVFQMSWKDCEELNTDPNYLTQASYNSYIKSFVESMRSLMRNDSLVFINRVSALPVWSDSKELGEVFNFGAEQYRQFQTAGIEDLKNYIVDDTVRQSSYYSEGSEYILDEGTEAVKGRDQITFSHNDIYEEGMNIAATLTSALGISTYIEYLDVTLYNSVSDINGVVLWNNNQGLSEEQIASMSKSDMLKDTANARELTQTTDNLFVSDLNDFAFYYVLFYQDEIYAGMYKFDTVQVTSDELKVCISIYKKYNNEILDVSSIIEFAYYQEHIDDVSIVFNQFLDATTDRDTYATISNKLRTARNTDVAMDALATEKGTRLTTDWDNSGDALFFNASGGYFRDRDGTGFNPYIRFWTTPLHFINQIGKDPSYMFQQVGLGTDKVRGLYLWTAGVNEDAVKITIISSGAFKIAEYYEFDLSECSVEIKDEITSLQWDYIDKRTANLFHVYTCGKKVFLTYKNSLVVGLYTATTDEYMVSRTGDLEDEETGTFTGDLHGGEEITYYKYKPVGSTHIIYDNPEPIEEGAEAGSILIPAWWDMWYLCYYIENERVYIISCSGDTKNTRKVVALDDMTELKVSPLQNTELYPGPKYDINNVTTLYYVGGKILEQLIRQYGQEETIKNTIFLDNGIVYCESHGVGEQEKYFPYRFFPLSYRGSKYFEYPYTPNETYYGISNQGHYSVSKSDEGSPVIWYSRFIDEVRYYQTESSETSNPSESKYSLDGTGITFDDYTVLYYRGFLTLVYTGTDSEHTPNEYECIALDLFKNNSNN